MRVVEIGDAFGLEHLRLVERPDPKPGPGRLLLRMGAASLNYRDLLTVRGHYNPKQPLPLIPCSDGAGEVVEVGEGVRGFEMGDRVLPLFAPRWQGGEPDPGRMRTTLGGPLDGTLAERMVVGVEEVVRTPEHLSDAEAATLPCAALTAWTAVVAEGGIKTGDTVLVLGTGGVSIFALQFAQLSGARVIVTSSGDEKLERARELGAWRGVNYRDDPGWGKTVRGLTGGRGVDLVVEVGGAGTLEQSLAAVRMGGRIALIGVLAGGGDPFPLTRVLMNRVRIQGTYVGHRESFEAMNRAIEAHRLRPVVDAAFPLARVREALEHMAAGRHFAKIVIDIPGD